MKITLVMAQTADGKVARGASEFVDWTPKEDKKFFAEETKRIGVIVMGRKTFDTIGRPLPGRHLIIMSRTPREPIKDERGSVEFTNETPEQIVKRIEAEGHTELAIGGGPTINSLFLKAGLLHEIKLTIGPRVFGHGLSLFTEPTETQLELLEHRLLTHGTLLMHYRVIINNDKLQNPNAK